MSEISFRLAPFSVVQRPRNVSALAQHAAAVHMQGRRLEAHAGQPLLVAQVARFLLVGVQVVLVGRVVVLAHLGGLAALVPGAGHLRLRRASEGERRQQDQQCSDASASEAERESGEQEWVPASHADAVCFLCANVLCCAAVLAPLDRRAGCGSVPTGVTTRPQPPILQCGRNKAALWCDSCQTVALLGLVELWRV
jgi:hypothetical protein